MRQDLVLDYGGVGLDVDGFDSEGRDLGKKDAAKRVGDGGINVDEVKLGEEGGIAVEFDSKGLGGGGGGCQRVDI